MILAIDPGNIESAYVRMEQDLRPLEFGKIPNDDLRKMLMRETPNTNIVLEMVACYGMGVGEDVIETVFWIGRFFERATGYTPHVYRMKRMEVKMHICHDSRAKDVNIHRALVDRFSTHDRRAGKGTKKNPDWFYGFADDIWQAYALGVTFAETKLP